ncbi:AraC family transcriptional regulator [Cytobacillus purgationiresistens]|uniref:AraC-like DNA-binding protein n=1 Tax=Cytobacillus purgationiresistens TaxID=863449 RepID=A0ABU0ANS7_9BACI|nr:AraC family ligand binding domain-containing protein [Cytobacillus purgationiresistens]MDQ0271715.1 AraC-like DNA-binding protein [Cytobacillus purgationiresistens]
MNKFNYKKFQGVTALSASITDFKYKKHSHREYALGVTLNGVQKYNLDGTSMLSYQNGVMLFNPEQTHDGMAGGHSALDYAMLYIDPTIILEVVNKKEMIKFQKPIVYNRELASSIINLHNSITSQKDDVLCCELIINLIGKVVQIDPINKYKAENVRIKKAKEIMHSNLSKTLKLEEICIELGISNYQFIRLFNAQTGISPYQYYLNCKVERAKKVIEDKRDVYIAVTECGFVDLTHLNKHFKRIYGTTAFEYNSQLN